ncbi:T9SS type B sorting domain-containing protein [Lacinutrix sp. WUR7]|uniref:T9SS type B sorting domain-containing protein n=1 Tax=Lacinutrix sp. WUR7 TaxID=2653681 RepID=UPI00193D0092|nr:T9SS type B sorting domain-containing protein [Lacinutrix sp. WUR7]QRM89670.1 T9SS type B sorting domain-containing protein [Lacinutrix sp. WUR7]
MKKILYLLFLTYSLTYSQDQASNWYFGDNAGISFDNNTGAVTALTDGLLRTDEGCTSISDNDGNLLFYTDGITVYNRNHQVMLNGNTLYGNPSSTQSAIIIPKPEDPNIFYIFTQGTTYQSQPDRGFNYSEVDMTLAGGLGGLTTLKNQRLLYKASEKLSAVLKDCVSGNIWVVSYADNDALTNPSATDSNNNTFYAFEVSPTGVNTNPTISTTGGTISERRGYLKLSPDGTKLVSANIRRGLFLFDFDVTDGSVSNPQLLNINSAGLNGAIYAYGVEFSSNSELLYISTYNDYSSTSSSQNDNPNNHKSALLQFDLTAANIAGSQVTIESKQGFRSALQLGPDNKIYKTESSTYNTGLPNLSTIEAPNTLGINCNYTLNTISLNGRLARQGLPPFISSFFSEKIDIIDNTSTTQNIQLPLCIGENYTLVAEVIPGATYTWTNNGIPIATPTVPNELTVFTDGNYEVLIEIPGNDCESKEGQAIVSYYTPPVANQPLDLSVCDDNNNDQWAFDFTSQNADILGTQDSRNFSVHYFASQEDADDFDNEIIGSYDNQDNPQTIFARIQNIAYSGCYDTTSFTIKVFKTPTANFVDNFTTCDDDVDGDDTNGQIEVVLTDFDSEVLGTQNIADYAVSYHDSQANADSGNTPLANTYYTQTPFLERIFVRIENRLNSECYDTTFFDVIVNPLPSRFDSSLIQCDEDGVTDGFTTFNLTEAEDALTGGATNVSITYFRLLLDAESEQNELDATNYPNTLNPQEVFALIKYDTTGCTSIAKLTLEVSTTQILDYNAQPACDELDSEDGINSFDLDVFTTDIQTINSITFPVNYYENYNDALLEQDALTSPYPNTNPYTHTIYARAENGNSCYGISEVNLTVNKRPQLIEDETTFYCLNAYPETVPIESGVIGDPNDYTYSWSTGETTNQIQINQVGTYTITVTNADNCEKSRTITVEPSSIANIESVDIIDASTNNTITVNASGDGEYEYALFNDAGLHTYYQSSPIFTNVTPGGIYTVSVRDIKNGCGVEKEIISVIGFPKFFSPNNDGINDYWQVYGVSSLFQPNSKIKIFDRYGKLLKQISPIGQGWDGTFNGGVLPNDDYWFSVLLQDGREYFNHFTLKR